MSSDNASGQEGPNSKVPLLAAWRQRITSDPRIARVIHGSVSALVGRGLTVAVNIILLPLTLRYLGKLEFGIWVTISTSVVMLSVLDLGIANTLTNFIAEASAKDDRVKATHSFATAFWVTLGIVAGIAPVLWFAWGRTDWGALFNLAGPLERSSMQNSASVWRRCFFFALSPCLSLGKCLPDTSRSILPTIS